MRALACCVLGAMTFLAARSGTCAAADDRVIIFSGWDYKNSKATWDIFRLAAFGVPTVIVGGPESAIYPFALPNQRAFGYMVERPRGSDRHWLFKCDLDTGATTDLGIFVNSNSTCQVAPDGKRIACADGVGSLAQVVIFDLESKQKRQVTSLRNQCLDPSWSPDGKNLVYWTGKRADRVGEESKPAGDHLAICNLETGQHRLLTKAPRANDSYPRWSPDGQWIAFHRFGGRRGAWHIWIIRPDGSEPTQLTTGAAEDSHPSWSPDSKQILFQSTRGDGAFNLYTLDVATKRVTALTQSQNREEHQPIWIQ